jgi:hypothetical protein
LGVGVGGGHGGGFCWMEGGFGIGLFGSVQRLKVVVW